MREIIVDLGPLVAFTALVCGPLASWLARARGRNAVLWLVYGTLLGPIGVLLAWLAPQSRCAVCDRPTQGWLTTCARHTPSRPTDLPVHAGDTSEPAVRRVRRILTTAAAPMARPITLVGGTRPGPDEPIPRSSPMSIPTAVLDELTILASGVFAGGSEPLELGARYAITRLGDRVRILGPLNSTPEIVRLDLSLVDLVVATVADRLLLTGPVAAGRRDFVLTFQALAGTHGQELEVALTPRPAEAKTRPRRRATQ